METTQSCICSICTNRCIMDVAVEDGKLLSAKPRRKQGFEGCSLACMRGLCAASYEYRSDRLTTPLRRIGQRGDGEFVPISWDEALDEISRRLLALRSEYGADSVSFYSGYSKWYRPMLHRLACSFGSVNYGTESSACHHAAVLARMCDTGYLSAPDYRNAGTLLAFARGRLPMPAKDAHARGMKIIVVDPRASRDIRGYADLHLRPRPGTDAALAHAISNLLIARGAADLSYISEHVHGYEAYRDYVAAFSPERAEELTGVPAEQITAAADMIAEHLPLSLYDGFSGTVHHRNGVQMFRAWDALNAVTGCYGRPGGTQAAGTLLPDTFTPNAVRDYEFAHPVTLPRDGLIGRERFPVWAEKIDECQCMDYPAAVSQGKLRGIFALGMNARMFPDSEGMFRTLEKLDFYVDCDLWLSDSAMYADIVLPVATSYERDQVAQVGGNRKLWFSCHAVDPQGQSRSDEDILCELARRMELDDPLLTAGKESCWEWQLEQAGLSLESLKSSGTPVPMPAAEPAPQPLTDGFLTPTGKFELFSELLAANGFDALPVYTDPFRDCDTEQYPLILMAGVRTDRYAHAIHSRTHTVPMLRRNRPEAAVDLHPSDAAALHVGPGDTVRLQTAFGSIEVGIDLDSDLLPGTVNMFHGYSEADVNSLIPPDWLDPISGFPGYKSVPCRIEKC